MRVERYQQVSSSRKIRVALVRPEGNGGWKHKVISKVTLVCQIIDYGVYMINSPACWTRLVDSRRQIGKVPTYLLNSLGGGSRKEQVRVLIFAKWQGISTPIQARDVGT